MAGIYGGVRSLTRTRLQERIPANSEIISEKPIFGDNLFALFLVKLLNLQSFSPMDSGSSLLSGTGKNRDFAGLNPMTSPEARSGDRFLG
jgi:hypothetical protein